MRGPQRHLSVAIRLPLRRWRMAQYRVRRHRRGDRGRLAPAPSLIEGHAFSSTPKPLNRALCQNATEIERILTLGTRTERTVPESADEARTLLFTARYRVWSQTAHHIQQHRDRPQQAAGHEG